MTDRPNAYSPEWYEIFLDTIPADATHTEVAFVERQLPIEEFPALLDLCCGPARHARALAARGYRVLGVDSSPNVIERARSVCPAAEFEVGDMRSLVALGRRFDAVVNLWHSFGYFDDATNLDVLRQVHATLRDGGRAILDVYNRDHFAARPSEETVERGGRRIRTTRSWNGPRHRMSLEYDGVVSDRFEWRLYSPGELRELCAAAGLATRVECAWFDESKPPSPEHARMQLVLERVQPSG